MKVIQLNIYPVKSLAGIQLESMCLAATGPSMDRRFLVVKPNGMFLTQRQQALMSQIECELGGGLLILRSRRDQSQHCSINYNELETQKPNRTVTVWNDQVRAVDCGDEAAKFLSDQLGQELRLVLYANYSSRKIPVKEDYPKSGNFGQVAFADAYPILIANQQSLNWLSERAGFDIEMDRFRANIVIDELPAFEEGNLGRFKIGEAELEIFSPCSRCIMPSIDQSTGEKNADVRSALNSYLKAKSGIVYFGYNAIIHKTGVLKVDDPVVPASASQE